METDSRRVNIYWEEEEVTNVFVEWDDASIISKFILKAFLRGSGGEVSGVD